MYLPHLCLYSLQEATFIYTHLQTVAYSSLPITAQCLSAVVAVISFMCALSWGRFALRCLCGCRGDAAFVEVEVHMPTSARLSLYQRIMFPDVVWSASRDAPQLSAFCGQLPVSVVI